MSSTPDTILHLPVDTCSCGHALTFVQPLTHLRRQQIEIPLSPCQITEYQADVKICPHCHRKITAAFPPGIEHTITFGDNLKALLLYLRNADFMPFEQLTRFFKDIYALQLSPATMTKILGKASASLDGYTAEIRQDLLKSPILHADETGFRVKGERWWLHSLSNTHLTYYDIHRTRGSGATKEIGILPHYTGTLIHDFWSGYTQYTCDHAYCNAHIIRELQGIYDGYKQDWAREMRGLIEEIYTYAVQEKGRSPIRLGELERRYDEVVERGMAENPPPSSTGKRGKKKRTKALNLLIRLKAHKSEILRFMYGEGIPFTNNQAERDLRMMKVQQKISGTFRSVEGADVFCRIRGYIATIRKNGKSVFQAMRKLAREEPFTLKEIRGVNSY